MKRHSLRRLLTTFYIIVLVLAATTTAALVTTQAAPLPPLRMNGVLFNRDDGSRFVIAGINIEAYRDYAGGCGWASDGAWSVRVNFAQRLKSYNVNIVRLNYSYRFLQTAQNFNRYMDMAEAFANEQIYVMPSDHTYTGNVLTSASASYPMMKQIWDNANARGIGNYIVMNPWNEPGPDITVNAWKTAQQGVLTYLRQTAGFNGIVVLDGTSWATLLDVTAFKAVQAFDAGLRGGSPNVAFSHHLYPNITGLPSQIWGAADEVPLVVGELGQENPGASSLQPSYVTGVISGFFSTGRAAGHNGLFAWIWNWCDTNKMLNDWGDPSVPYTNASSLSSHGTLWKTNYYDLLPSTGTGPTNTPTNTPTRTLTPIPTRTSVASPTRTITPTFTPSATRTGSVTPSRTPTLTPTPLGSPTPTCLTFTSNEGKIITVCIP